MIDAAESEFHLSRFGIVPLERSHVHLRLWTEGIFDCCSRVFVTLTKGQQLQSGGFGLDSVSVYVSS